MSSRRLMRPVLAGALLLFGVAAAPLRSDPPPAAFAQIERGQWLLKERTEGDRKLCLTAPGALVQIRHGAVSCEQFVVVQDQRSATVRYTCAGHGQGRTTITIVTPRSLRIETQGVIDGAPFALDYDASKLGPC